MVVKLNKLDIAEYLGTGDGDMLAVLYLPFKILSHAHHPPIVGKGLFILRRCRAPGSSLASGFTIVTPDGNCSTVIIAEGHVSHGIVARWDIAVYTRPCLVGASSLGMFREAWFLRGFHRCFQSRTAGDYSLCGGKYGEWARNWDDGFPRLFRQSPTMDDG